MICVCYRKSGVEKGVESIMAFFMYNFNEPNSQLLYTRGKLFIKDIKPQVQKHLKSKPLEARSQSP